MRGCSDQIKNLTLELGGKNANIVFGDADLAAAAASAPGGFFDNAGQDCCSRSRMLVQADVYDEVMAALETAVKEFTVTDPFDPAADMGPLISAGHRDSVAAYVDSGEVAFTGTAPDGPGFWFPPTVLTPATTASADFTEEIFGPVLSVVRFETEQEAIRIVNDTDYGLSGSIWTRDLDRAMRVSRAVEAGNLSVNSHSSVRYSTPFGGYKQSGLGRELGPDAVDAFTETKNVFFSIGGSPTA
jgi:acyl-CoA reductase-like NAD-dependent aldehyde dehydrogenase